LHCIASPAVAYATVGCIAQCVSAGITISSAAQVIKVVRASGQQQRENEHSGRPHIKTFLRGLRLCVLGCQANTKHTGYFPKLLQRSDLQLETAEACFQKQRNDAYGFVRVHE